MESPITTALISSAAATVGSCASYTLFYPLEAFRTRLQAKPTTFTPHNPTLDISLLEQPPLETSTFSIQTIAQKLLTRLKQIWAEILETIQFGLEIYNKQGISAFYQGLGTGVFGIGISNAIYTYWYQLLKDLMINFRNTLRTLVTTTQGRRQNKRTLSPLDNIIVASLAGVVNITITNPIWVVNLRQTLRNKEDDDQDARTTTTTTTTNENNKINIEPTTTTTTTTTSHNINPLSTASSSSSSLNSSKTMIQSLWEKIVAYFKSTELYKIISQEGFLALYKGYAASLVLVLNPTIQFVLYDQITSYLQDYYNQSSLSNSQLFIVAAFCKALSTIATFPYLVVKTRMQQEQKKQKSTFGARIISAIYTVTNNNNNNNTQSDNNIEELTPNDVDQTDIVTELGKIQSQEEAMGLYETMMKMYKEEGIEVFFSGIIPKLIQTVSNTALTTVLHERIKDQMMKLLVKSKYNNDKLTSM